MNDTVPAVSIRVIPAGSAWLRLSGKEKRRSQSRSPRSCHTQLIRCWYSGLGRAFLLSPAQPGVQHKPDRPFTAPSPPPTAWMSFNTQRAMTSLTVVLLLGTASMSSRTEMANSF